MGIYVFYLNIMEKLQEMCPSLLNVLNHTEKVGLVLSVYCFLMKTL